MITTLMSQLKMDGFQIIQKNHGRWVFFQEPMPRAGDHRENDGETMPLVSSKPLSPSQPIWAQRPCIQIMFYRLRITMKDMTFI